MKLLRKILFPLNPLYYSVVFLRNKCFDFGIFKSKSYKTPIICVGNLSVGGTGKTPMIETLIQLLQKDYNVAVLSRGYGRQSKGFVLAKNTSTAKILGDEPYQIAQKFPNVTVAVDANRQRGIDCLLHLNLPPNVILLDDAFQHRKVKPGLSILLTAYDNLFCDDSVLPSGNLREPRFGAQRAQVVIVTKLPNDLNSIEKENIAERLALHPNQKLFFSSIVYSNEIESKTDSILLEELKTKNFTLVTGIANAKPLVNYLKRLNLNFEHLEYDDHHEFSEKELKEICSKSFVLTTEKDFSRLQSLQHKALYYLPITTQVYDMSALEKIVKDFIKKS
jgi:tetraacyldisaccharide 4'-kinase